jgi:chemotaxis protein MotB
MPRKRLQPVHGNHERWLVSYADFITLMFAFFVVMFASSQADKGKVKQVSAAVARALESGSPSSAVAEMFAAKSTPNNKAAAVDMKNLSQLEVHTPPAQMSAHAAELLPSLEYLNTELKKEIESGKMRVSLEGRGLVVSLQQATFFPSGEDTLDPATYSSLEKVATAISKLPNPVRLEGHTDAIPIHTARFRSNWELSAARSIAVLDLLSTRFSVARDRMAVTGYAETVPLASNESDQGRARNRRVDIVILSRQQMEREPVPEAAGVPVTALPKPASDSHARK